MTPHMLGPADWAPGRTFTHPRYIAGDQRRLEQFLGHVRTALATSPTGPTTFYDDRPQAHPPHHWRVRVMLLQPARLHQLQPLLLVGFLGRKRPHVDATSMNRSAAAISAALYDQPDLLSYNTAAVGHGDYINLVLFAVETAVDRWLEGAAHTRAVHDVAPAYYRFIRLYRGWLPQGLEDLTLSLTRIKYLDYRHATLWVGLRDLNPAPPNNETTL